MTLAVSQCDAPEAPAGGLGLEDLRDLMRAVTDTTARLEQTHVSLQAEVARLKNELAEANAQLRRSRELAALGEMAAGIAHEIRNPLGSIQLYVQMLGEDLAEAPAQAQLCEKIGRAVTGLDAIVRDVLLFAREMRMKAVPIDAGMLIDQTLIACAALVGSCAVEVEIDDDGLQPTVDANLLTQALANVIRNAVEAMSEASVSAPRLRIAARRRRLRRSDGRLADHAVFAIEDSGPGIPPEVLERMFNPFFTTRQAGTGLGLAIVHRIVDAHGGHVHVDHCEGGGARVELRLPLRPASARGTTMPRPVEVEILDSSREGHTNGAGARRRSIAKAGA